MTLDKAIKQLQSRINKSPETRFGDDQEALMLGVEALKRLKRVRDGKPGYLLNLMPGETEK